MSFICGLSTMATLIEPPLPLPPPPEVWPLVAEPAAAGRDDADDRQQGRRHAERPGPSHLIAPLPRTEGQRVPPHTRLTYSLALCWMSSRILPIPQRFKPKSRGIVFV